MRPSATALPPEQGIYVHIPYCLAKCRYCGFNSFPTDGGVPESYVDALSRDIRREAVRWAGGAGGRFATVYLGGGTPSLLSERQVEVLLTSLRAAFAVDADAEVTLECNPATVGEAGLAGLRRLGVTRLSVGVQSLDDRELALLGRIHRGRDAAEALRDARLAGFAEVSADLMIGIPGQTARSLAATLAGILDFVTHLSVYMLTVEAGTPLERMVGRGQVTMPTDEAVADLYQLTGRLLARRGFRSYEISNWSLPGHACRHNEIYWRRGNYVGLGAGAHSHLSGVRSARWRDPRRYAAAVVGSGNAVEMSESLSSGQMLLEEIMLALRTRRGIDPAELICRHPLDAQAFGRLLSDLAGAGYLVGTGSTAALSPKGMLVADAVVAEIAALVVPTGP